MLKHTPTGTHPFHHTPISSHPHFNTPPFQHTPISTHPHFNTYMLLLFSAHVGPHTPCQVPGLQCHLDPVVVDWGIVLCCCFHVVAAHCVGLHTYMHGFTYVTMPSHVSERHVPCTCEHTHPPPTHHPVTTTTTPPWAAQPLHSSLPR